MGVDLRVEVVGLVPVRLRRTQGPQRAGIPYFHQGLLLTQIPVLAAYASCALGRHPVLAARVASRPSAELRVHVARPI